jgi:tRNA dimethylallyltransferase
MLYVYARARAQGWPALHAELARVDPVTAARLPPTDRQRIQRALEVHALTGVPLSQLQAKPQGPSLNLRTVALVPSDRAELHRRIAARFDAMIAAGFLDEVRALMARGDLDPDLPSLRAVGYRQAWRHLSQGSRFEAFRAATVAATRQLAKRQLTWLRSMRDAVIVDPFAADATQRVAALVREATAAHPERARIGCRLDPMHCLTRSCSDSRTPG